MGQIMGQETFVPRRKITGVRQAFGHRAPC